MAERIDIVVVATDAASGVLSQIGGAFGNLGSIITGIESALNLAGRAFGVFQGLATEGLDAIANYERLGATMETLVAKELLMSGAATDMNQALAMSSTQAKELIQWNQTLAINSPFSSEGVTEAFRMAMAYGFTTDEAKKLTEVMIDFAAGSGATEASMQQIARALGQMSATGKVTAGDMMQLINAGLPVTEILAKGFNVTTAELMDMRQKGLLPADEAIRYITEYLETNFAGAAERQANTWGGLLNTFGDLKAMGLREFFTGMYDAIKPFTLELVEWLQGPGLELIREWGARLGEFTASIMPAFERAFEAINQGKDIFESLAIGLKSIGGDETPQWLVKLAFFIEDVGVKFRAFMDLVKDVGWVEAIKQTIGGLIDSIMSGITASGGFEGALQNMVDKLTVVLANTNWTQVGETAARVVTGVIETVLKGLDVIITKVDWRPFGEALYKALGEVISGFGSVLGRYVYWDQWVAFFKQGLPQALSDGIASGLRNSITTILNTIAWMVMEIINKFKSMLGIASPSSIFAQIARDMVAGLILGWTGAIGTFLSTVTSSLATIMNGAQATVTGGASAVSTLGSTTTSPGSVGGRSMGGTTTDTRSLSGGGVVNNYYGPVYFQGAGEPGAYYECPTNNPLATSSGSTLTTNRVLGTGR